MSWTSRLGNLGRFSPFSRSPTSQSGSTRISDADYSYITADDLRREQAEAQMDSPARDTDVVVLRTKKRDYHVHFPAYSIDRGEISIAQLRETAAQKLGLGVARDVRLKHNGRILRDDLRSCDHEGLRNGSDIAISIGDAKTSSSESEGEDDMAGGVDGHGEHRKRRNRGKKTKRRNKREAAAAEHSPYPPESSSHLGVHSVNASSSSRAPSPNPKPGPQTPNEKLAELDATLREWTGQADHFRRHPPADPAKKDFEHKRLSETILAQVLLKLDAVEVEGDNDARARRKQLVKDAQGVLADLDASVKA